MNSNFSAEIALLDGTDPTIWEARLALLERRKNLIIVVKQRKICFINAVGLQWLGLSSEHGLLNSDISDIFATDYRAIADSGLEPMAQEDMIPLKLICQDGNEIDVELWVDRLESPSDEIFLIEARNITEHLRAARALRSREQWLEGVINTVADGIMTVDHNGVVQSFNPAAERIFRFSADEVIGKSIRKLVPMPIPGHGVQEQPALEWTNITSLGEKLRGRRKDGDTFPMEMSIRELRRGDSVSYTGVVRDISARRRAEDRIRHLAQHDALTGLPNRVLLNERLKASIQRATLHQSRLAVAFIDLNEFKPINDTYGHATGDKVLAAVADRQRQP